VTNRGLHSWPLNNAGCSKPFLSYKKPHIRLFLIQKPILKNPNENMTLSDRMKVPAIEQGTWITVIDQILGNEETETLHLGIKYETTLIDTAEMWTKG
jgi:hypothetical protein